MLDHNSILEFNNHIIHLKDLKKLKYTFFLFNNIDEKIIESLVIVLEKIGS